MQKNQFHVQTWRDMFAVLFRSTSCWPLSQAQRRRFIFGTGKQGKIFSHQDDCNSLCLFVYSNAYNQCTSHMAGDFYGSMILHRIAVASIASLNTGTHSAEQHRTSRPEPLLHSAQKNSYYICIAVNNCFKLRINAHCTGKSYTMNETYPSIEHFWILVFFVLFYSFPSYSVLLYFVLFELFSSVFSTFFSSVVLFYSILY